MPHLRRSDAVCRTCVDRTHSATPASIGPPGGQKKEKKKKEKNAAAEFKSLREHSTRTHN
eukprot:15054994-Heterocapsa_arctica.AAC.1